MTANKKSRPVYCNTLNGKKRSIAKSSNCILSLKRAAVKLAITADLVLLLAALGSINITRRPAGAESAVRTVFQGGIQP